MMRRVIATSLSALLLVLAAIGIVGVPENVRAWQGIFGQAARAIDAEIAQLVTLIVGVSIIAAVAVPPLLRPLTARARRLLISRDIEVPKLDRADRAIEDMRSTQFALNGGETRSLLWLFAGYSELLADELVLNESTPSSLEQFLEDRSTDWMPDFLRALSFRQLVAHEYRQVALADSRGMYRSRHALPKYVYSLTEFGFEVLDRLDTKHILASEPMRAVASLRVQQDGIRIETNSAISGGYGWGLDVWNDDSAEMKEVRAHLDQVVPMYVDESMQPPPTRSLHWPGSGSLGRIPGRSFTRVNLLRYSPDVSQSDSSVAEWAYASMDPASRQRSAKLTLAVPVVAKIRFSSGDADPYFVLLGIDTGSLSNQAIDITNFGQSDEEPFELLYAGTDDQNIDRFRHGSKWVVPRVPTSSETPDNEVEQRLDEPEAPDDVLQTMENKFGIRYSNVRVSFGRPWQMEFLFTANNAAPFEINTTGDVDGFLRSKKLGDMRATWGVGKRAIGEDHEAIWEVHWTLHRHVALDMATFVVAQQPIEFDFRLMKIEIEAQTTGKETAYRTLDTRASVEVLIPADPKWEELVRLANPASDPEFEQVRRDVFYVTEKLTGYNLSDRDRAEILDRRERIDSFDHPVLFTPSEDGQPNRSNQLKRDILNRSGILLRFWDKFDSRESEEKIKNELTQFAAEFETEVRRWDGRRTR